jgi:hypothetical protein
MGKAEINARTARLNRTREIIHAAGKTSSQASGEPMHFLIIISVIVLVAVILDKN